MERYYRQPIAPIVAEQLDAVEPEPLPVFPELAEMEESYYTLRDYLEDMTSYDEEGDWIEPASRADLLAPFGYDLYLPIE